MDATLSIGHFAIAWVYRFEFVHRYIPEQCMIIIEVWGQVICGQEENTKLLHHTLLLPFPHIFNVHRCFARPTERDRPAYALGECTLLFFGIRAEFGGGDEVFDGRTHRPLRSRFLTALLPLT
jgi:hypothetical protein